ncbi:DNA replication protein DnaD [Weissella ceti]|nr:DnaD domain protein [Weissella ceti]AIM64262.1 DNA replication protein DnaD [Weissella ceti]
MENQEKVTAFFNAPMVGLSTYVVEHYRELGMTNDEFLLMVHLLTQMTRFDGDVQLQMVANQLGWSVEGVSRGIEQLREKEYLTDHAKRDGNGKVATQLDFSPLYMKILAFDVDALPIISTSARVVTQGENALEQLDKESNLSRADIFNMVEQEFGRPLSPMEINTIKNWFDIDHFRADFIQVAIQEAVLNGALSSVILKLFWLHGKRRTIIRCKMCTPKSKSINNLSNAKQQIYQIFHGTLIS